MWLIILLVLHGNNSKLLKGKRKLVLQSINIFDCRKSINNYSQIHYISKEYKSDHDPAYMGKS